MASCPHCGSAVAADARFCPQCGRRLEESTRVLEVPDDTGPAPVEMNRVEPRWYGVTPSTLVLALAAATLVASVVTFVLGRWPIGLILLGAAFLLVLVFLEAARRKPSGAASRATVNAVDHVRGRAGAAAAMLATRGRVAAQAASLRRELQRLERTRHTLLYELGDAVYRRDDEATESARARVVELDERVAQKEIEMKTIVEQAAQRMAKRRFEVQPTEVAQPPEPGPQSKDEAS